VTVIAPEGVNVRDLLVHDAVLITRRDLLKIEEAFA
jgi:ribosomal protein L4